MKLKEPEVFTQGVFGEEAILNEKPITGIFDEEYTPVFGELGESRRFTFRVKTPPYPVRHGWSFKYLARNFRVVNVEPVEDGRFLDLVLREL